MRSSSQLFIFSLLAAASPAHAGSSVDVQLYRPPFNLNYGMTESAIHDNAPWDEKAYPPKIFGAADYSYVKDPLVTIDTTTNSRVNTLVNSVHTLDLSGGYFFSPGASVYAQLPVTYSNLPTAGGAVGLADSRIAGKFALNDVRSSLNFALMPEIDLPTGNQARFLSDGGLGVGALLIAENDFGAFRLSGNIGYRYNSSAQMPGIDYRNRVPLGLGAAIPIARQWLLNLEGNGALALPTAQQQNASNFYGGLSYSPKKYMTWLFGAAIGAFDQAGSSEYRLTAGLRVYFDEKPAVAARYEPPPPPSPPAPKPKPTARMSEDRKRIDILEEIQFDNNKDTLKPRGKQILAEVAEIILQNADAIEHIEIDGHTSHTGSYKHNMDLSWRRARAVVAYLVHDQKIPAKMLVPKGYGWTKPKFKLGHASQDQLAQNRRVEFFVFAKAKP